MEKKLQNSITYWTKNYGILLLRRKELQNSINLGKTVTAYHSDMVAVFFHVVEKKKVTALCNVKGKGVCGIPQPMGMGFLTMSQNSKK